MHPFTEDRRDSVGALGEERLIASIRRWLGRVSPAPPFGIGDDCAVLPASHGRQLLTVDPVIYGRHFDDTISPASVGAKLLKRNLSDLAAMGGRPVAAVLALTLDARTRHSWLEKFYRGLAAAARRFHVSIVGGDVAQADGVIIASLTLLGEAAGSRVLTRVGAKKGDWIYVTGTLGGSLASGHHHRFVPRLAEGAWLARRAEVRSMIDVSDGLAKDLPALAPPGSTPALDSTCVPCRAGFNLRSALTEGEDYELLFTVRRLADCAKLEHAWRRTFPRTRVTRIGQFVAPRDLPAAAVSLAGLHGYEHLR